MIIAHIFEKPKGIPERSVEGVSCVLLQIASALGPCFHILIYFYFLQNHQWPFKNADQILSHRYKHNVGSSLPVTAVSYASGAGQILSCF